jgi:ABC-type hemin transport system substrate-binding protein
VCVKAKADSTTKYLVEQFKAEIAALQTNNQKLEEQQKQIFGFLKKKGKEILGEPVAQE